MKSLIDTRRRILINISFLLSILAISGSCTKSSMDDMGGTGGKGGPGSNEVLIRNMAFDPSTLTVKEGTTITWTNKDGVNHTVTSDAGLFDSGSLGAGGSFSFTFSTAGTYPYHCTLHPEMTAKIIVTSAQVSSASVSIQSMSFTPATITVKAGTIITWTNNDSADHTVTSDTNLFTSGQINAPGLYTSGGSFSYTFTAAGTYPYHCSYHSSMKGTVIVN
jgi:plastocyanin